MGDTLKLQVANLGREVVEEHYGAVAACEELLEGKHLPAIAQCVLRQQPHLRERVDDHPRRLDAVDLRENELRCHAELQVGRLEHRVLVVRLEVNLRWHQLGSSVLKCEAWDFSLFCRSQSFC